MLHTASKLLDQLQSSRGTASSRIAHLQKKLAEEQEEEWKQALRAKIADASDVIEPALVAAEGSLRDLGETLCTSTEAYNGDSLAKIDRDLESAASVASHAEKAVQTWGADLPDAERHHQEVTDARSGHQQRLRTIENRRGLLQQEAEAIQQSLTSRIEEKARQEEARQRAQAEERAEQERQAAEDARRQAAVDALGQRHLRIAKAVDSFEESVASGGHKTPSKERDLSAEVPLGTIRDLQLASSQDLHQLSRDLSDLQDGGMTKSDSLQSLLHGLQDTKSRLHAASAELDTLRGQDDSEPDQHLENAKEYNNADQSSAAGGHPTWIEDFGSLSTAVLSLRDSRIPSQEDNTQQISDLKQRLANLQRTVPTDPQLRVSDASMKSLKKDLEHVDAMNSFQVKKAAADSE